MKGKVKQRTKTSIVVAFALVLVMFLTTMLTPAQVAYGQADTSSSENYTQIFGAAGTATTKNSGRVWSDKSVYNDPTVDVDGVSFTLDQTKNEDFNVVYTVIGSSQQISGVSKVPVDVVFALDVSGSMNKNLDDKNTKSPIRMVATVDGLNTAIKEICENNENSRVAVTTWSSGYEGKPYNKTLLGLDHYDTSKVASPISYSSEKISENLSGKSNSVDVNGTTNTQVGIAEGMDVLLKSDPKALINGKEVKRIPVFILLSDGLANQSSINENWWEVSSIDKSGDKEDSELTVMKALMTAAYKKQAVEKHYGVASLDVYTMGLSIPDKDKSRVEAVLNPTSHYDTAKEDDYLHTIRGYFDTYTSNKEVTVKGKKKKYTFYHPSSGDISSLKYNKAYFDVSDAQAMTDAIGEILNNINVATPDYPTEIEGLSNATNGGYVTYTDPIGEYMEVKDVKALVINGQKFTVTKGQDGSYSCSGKIKDPVTGDEIDVDQIKISISSDKDGNQTLVAKIPAAYIPLIIDTVTLNKDGKVKTHTVKDSKPLRIVYSVGLQDKAKTLNGVSDEYIAKNTDADGKTNFYSNLFTEKDGSGKTIGDAYTSFTPAADNPNYYFQEDVVIYDNEERTNKVKYDENIVFDSNKNYYFATRYYNDKEVGEDVVVRKGDSLNEAKSNGDLINKDEYVALKKGTPRTYHIGLDYAVEKDKASKVPGTADMVYKPVVTRDVNKISKIDFYHGNNGLLKYSLPSNLTITKKVVNNISPEYNTTEDFEFTINLKDKDGQALTGEFNAELLDAEGKVVEGSTLTLVKDGSVVNIKSGQSLVIKGLPDGTQYTVKETAKDYYNTTIKVDGIEYTNADPNVVTGNTKSGTDKKVEYTNTYKITKPATLETTIKPEVVKNITGRTFKVGDKFRFVLQEETTTNPQTTEAVIDVTKDSELVGNNTATVHFDNDLTFDKPGTYKYTIKECNDNAVGINYSNALYSYDVIVKDNNDGTLTATAKFTQDKDDSGRALSPAKSVEKAVFTNDFNLKQCAVTLNVNKDYVNNSDTPIKYNKFNFEISADKDTPMPNTAVLTEDGLRQTAVITNKAVTTSFPSISYTEEGTYNYTIKEIIPEGVDGNNVLNGIKYDSTVHNIIVEVKAVKATESTGDYLKAIVKDATGTELKDNTVKFTNTYDVVSKVIGGDDPTTAAFDITKTIDGRNFYALDSFEFELKADENNPEGATILADTATISGSGVNGNVAHGKIGKIKFTRAGVYKFTINETAVDKAGFTLATNTEEVTVTVTDNHDGTLLAAIFYGPDKTSATFVNTYKSTGNTDDIPDPDSNPDPDPANKKNGICVTKRLDGRDWFEKDEFEFTIAPDLSDPDTKAAVDGGRIKMPSNTKLVLNKNNQNGKFNPIEFTTPNMTGDVAEYHFIVTETDTNIKGVKYAEPQIVVVKVKDNKNGTLEVTSDNHLLTFVNSYTPDPIDIGKKDPDPKPDPDKPEPPVDPNNPNTEDSTNPNNYIPLMAYKELNGRPLRDEEFTFTLKAVTVGAPMPKDAVDGKVTASNMNGIVKFGNIIYDVNHAGNTYEYKIEETTAAANGITPDSETIKVKVNVKNDKTLGKLVPTVTYEKGTKAEESKVQTFVNNYNPGNAEVVASTNLIVKKTYKGKQWNGETFRFTLTNISDVTIKDNVVSGGDQTLDITHTATDTDVIDGLNTSTTEEKAFAENIIFNKVGTYKFQIKEEVPAEPTEGTIVNDTKTYDITVDVTDDGNGVLKATVKKPAELTDGKLSFTNTYEPEDIVVGGKDPKPDPDQDPDSDTKIPDPDSKPDPNPDKYDPDTDPNKEDDNNPNCYLPIAAEKVMVGRSLNATDKFEFTLTALTEGAPMHKNADNTVLTKDVVVNDFKRVLFKDIVFGTESIDKEYQYEITEKSESANGVISDTGKVIVTVSIKYDAAKGKLIPTVSYAKTPETEGYKSNAFINEYKPNVPGILDGATHLNVTKRYKGKNWVDEKFTFKLALAKGDAANVQFTNNELTIDGTTDLSNANVTGEDLEVVTSATKAFGDIKFTGEGQYTFHITEVVPDPKDSHITYDNSVREIVVNVKDNGVGGYTVNIVKADNCVFNNTYTPDPVDIGEKPVPDPDPSKPDPDPDPNEPDPNNKNAYIPLMAKKVMNGRELKATDKFEFTLSAQEGTPMPEVTTVTNDGSAIIFGNIRFTNPDCTKPYTYVIKETAKSEAGVTSDSVAITATVSFKYDAAEGRYIPTVTYAKGSEAGDNKIKAFVNNYDPGTIEVGEENPKPSPDPDPDPDKPVPDPDPHDPDEELKTPNTYRPLMAYKVIKGRDLVEGEFEFKLTALTEGAPMPKRDTAVNTGNEVVFGKIVYDKSHAGNTYLYEIKETTKAGNGVTPDDGVVKVSVTINHDETLGKLRPHITYTKEGGVAVNRPNVFVNSYTPDAAVVDGSTDLKLEKSIDGRPWRDDDKFTFKIVADEADDATVAAVKNNKITLPAEAVIDNTVEVGTNGVKSGNFGDITFNEAGTYKFKVVENEPDFGGIKIDTPKNFTVVVTEDTKTGKLTAKVTEGAPFKFVNTYTNEEIVVDGSKGLKFNKELVGRDWGKEDTFTFNIEAVTKDAPMPIVTTVKVDKPASGNIAAFDFGKIKFTDADMKDVEFQNGVKKKEFEYKVTEVKPENTKNIAYAIPKTVKITVTDDGTGKLAAAVDIEGGETFENTFDTTSKYGDVAGEAGFKITKVLTNHAMKAKQFTFKIEGKDDLSKAKLNEIGGENGVLTAYNNAAEVTDTTSLSVVEPLAEMTFKHNKDVKEAGKTYNFTVSEVNDGAVGYGYDETHYDVTIAVSEVDANGNLSVTTTGGNVVFNNTYDADGAINKGDGTVEIKASKTLSGRTMEASEFKFKVFNTKDNKEVATGTNNADGAVKFTQINYNLKTIETEKNYQSREYNADGNAVYTFQYNVVEETENLKAGVTANTPNGFSILVKVTDNGDNTLTSEIVYPDGATELKFENAYNADTIELKVNPTKILNSNGSDISIEEIAGKYSFVIDVNGKAVYDPLMVEVEPEAAPAAVEPEATPEVAPEATPETEPAAPETASETEPVVVPAAAPVLKPAVESISTPLPEGNTVLNDAAGNIEFAPIKYTLDLFEGVKPAEDGSRTIKFSYKVTEHGTLPGIINDPETTKTFTVTVVDNGQGTISATVDPQDIIFTNTYNITPNEDIPTKPTSEDAEGTGHLFINKVLNGRPVGIKNGEFKFELKDMNGKVVTGSNNENGVVSLSPVTFTKAGDYTFTLSEVYGGHTREDGITYDPATYTVVAKVVDNHDGTLSVTWDVTGKENNSLEFVNTYDPKGAAVILGANKVLSGRDIKAGEFTFALKDADGNVLQTVTNDENGSVAFEEISYDTVGAYKYTVEEVKGADKDVTYDESVYEVTVNVIDDSIGFLRAEIVYENGSVIFHNIYTEPKVPEEPKKPEPPVKPAKPNKHRPPKTGDTNDVTLWAVLMMMAAAGVVIAGKKRKN